MMLAPPLHLCDHRALQKQESHCIWKHNLGVSDLIQAYNISQKWVASYCCFGSFFQLFHLICNRRLAPPLHNRCIYDSRTLDSAHT